MEKHMDIAESEQEKYQRDLEKLRTVLSARPRDLLLFEFLLQSQCRTKDILRVKVSDLCSCEENMPLPVLSSGENKGPIITRQIKSTFNQLLMQGELDNGDLLFKSRKGGRQLAATSVSRLITSVLNKAGLTDYKGLPELRKKLGPLTLDSVTQSSRKKGPQNDYRVETRSIQQTVYKQLLNGIISGDVPPGQRLLPDKLARELNVSTTPIREALSRLEAKGFVTHHIQRGWMASELSRERLKEILDLRILLECEAIYQAATRIRPETILRLEEASRRYEEISRTDDPLQSLEANQAFHMLAYQDAGSSMMQNIIEELFDLTSPYQQILFRQSLVPKLDIGVNHHAMILESLKNRNPEEARRWLREDIVKPAAFVFKLFDMYVKSIE